MKYLLLLMLPISAFADCRNLIDVSDAKNMVIGIPHGKTMLKCDEADCVCIDGAGTDWMIETSDLVQAEDGSYSFVPNKQKVADAEAAADAAKKKLVDDQAMKDSVMSKIKDGTASQAELLEYIKARDGL